MTGVARQRRGIDAELGDGASPFVLKPFVEDEIIIGGDMEPAIRLDLRIELAGTPTRITQGEQAAPWSPAAADRAQDIDASR